MNIEGAELKALEGARGTIKTYKSILAVCVYYKRDDLLTIPAYIRSICSEYKFYIRAYERYSRMHKERRCGKCYPTPSFANLAPKGPSNAGKEAGAVSFLPTFERGHKLPTKCWVKERSRYLFGSIFGKHLNRRIDVIPQKSAAKSGDGYCVF